MKKLQSDRDEFEQRVAEQTAALGEERRAMESRMQEELAQAAAVSARTAETAREIELERVKLQSEADALAEKRRASEELLLQRANESDAEHDRRTEALLLREAELADRNAAVQAALDRIHEDAARVASEQHALDRHRQRMEDEMAQAQYQLDELAAARVRDFDLQRDELDLSFETERQQLEVSMAEQSASFAEQHQELETTLASHQQELASARARAAEEQAQLQAEFEAKIASLLEEDQRRRDELARAEAALMQHQIDHAEVQKQSLLAEMHAERLAAAEARADEMAREAEQAKQDLARIQAAHQSHLDARLREFESCAQLQTAEVESQRALLMIAQAEMTQEMRQSLDQRVAEQAAIAAERAELERQRAALREEMETHRRQVSSSLSSSAPEPLLSPPAETRSDHAHASRVSKSSSVPTSSPRPRSQAPVASAHSLNRSKVWLSSSPHPSRFVLAPVAGGTTRDAPKLPSTPDIMTEEQRQARAEELAAKKRAYRETQAVIDAARREREAAIAAQKEESERAAKAAKEDRRRMMIAEHAARSSSLKPRKKTGRSSSMSSQASLSPSAAVQATISPTNAAAPHQTSGLQVSSPLRIGDRRLAAVHATTSPPPAEGSLVGPPSTVSTLVNGANSSASPPSAGITSPPLEPVLEPALFPSWRDPLSDLQSPPVASPLADVALSPSDDPQQSRTDTTPEQLHPRGHKRSTSATKMRRVSSLVSMATRGAPGSPSPANEPRLPRFSGSSLGSPTAPSTRRLTAHSMDSDDDSLHRIRAHGPPAPCEPIGCTDDSQAECFPTEDLARALEEIGITQEQDDIASPSAVTVCEKPGHEETVTPLSPASTVSTPVSVRSVSSPSTARLRALRRSSGPRTQLNESNPIDDDDDGDLSQALTAHERAHRRLSRARERPTPPKRRVRPIARDATADSDSEDE